MRVGRDSGEDLWRLEGDSEETLKRLVERRRDPWGRLVERKGHPGLPTIPKDLWKGSSESIARDREDRERTRDWRRKGERWIDRQRERRRDTRLEPTFERSGFCVGRRLDGDGRNWNWNERPGRNLEDCFP